MLARIENQLLVGLEGVITSARSVNSNYVSAKPSTLDAVFSGSVKALIGILTGLHHVSALIEIDGIKEFSHTVVGLSGISHLSHSSCEILGMLNFGEKLRNTYEASTKDYSLESQLKFINESFPPFSSCEKRAAFLVNRLVLSYGDVLSRLSHDSQLIFGGYVLSLILEYIRYGFLSERAKYDNKLFVNELMSWLAYRGNSLELELPTITLTTYEGNQVEADQILKQAGLICYGKHNNIVKYENNIKITSRIGYRFAVDDELPYIYSKLFGKNSPLKYQKTKINDLHIIPYAEWNSEIENTVKIHQERIDMLEGIIKDQKRTIHKLEKLFLKQYKINEVNPSNETKSSELDHIITCKTEEREMFTYQDSDAPEIWHHLLQEVSDFNVDETLNTDYARRLACKLIRVFSGEMTSFNHQVSDNSRWNLPYFDKIVELAYQISTQRSSYIDKDLSEEQQCSKDDLLRMGKIANNVAKEHILNISCEYKKSLVNLISEINPKNEYHITVKNRLEKLKNMLEIFKEQVLFLDLNKLIALCIVYLRYELTNVDLSNTEKELYLVNRIHHLNKVFIAPVYKSINKALDFIGYASLSKNVIQFNLSQLQEYGRVIYEDVIENTDQKQIKYREYPDPEIQFEIEKIKPSNQVSKEKNLSYLKSDPIFENAIFRKRTRVNIVRPTETTDIKKDDEFIILPPVIFDDFIIESQPTQNMEISCFAGLINEFSCFMSKKIEKNDTSYESDDDPFIYTFEL